MEETTSTTAKEGALKIAFLLSFVLISVTGGSLSVARRSVPAPAAEPRESFLPPNDLHLQDRVTVTANFGEAEFNAAIDRVAAYYAPIVTAHGGNLKMMKLWTNSTVNAEADRTGNDWLVKMYGGLARREEVTLDGFAVVVCHELGHHLGGFPFYRGDWAGSEGQADYFATQSCVKNLWGKDYEENARHRATVDPLAKEKCDAASTDTGVQNLCYRVADAGLSLARLLAALGSDTPPSFGTPDTSVVSRTRETHPRGQCRLDTYFQGVLCGARFDDGVIPGFGHAQGQESLGAETEAATYSCTARDGYAVGLRPRCWFKPRL